MFITKVLLRSAGGNGRPLQGNIWLGKHRVTHGIKKEHLDRMTKRLQVEEKNLFLLRHPYLTLEQESGHAAELKKHDKWLKGRKIFDAAVRIRPSIRMEDRLSHLNVSNKWELS